MLAGMRASRNRLWSAWAFVGAVGAGGLILGLGSSCALWPGKRAKDQTKAATPAPAQAAAANGGEAAAGRPVERFRTSATVEDVGAAATPSLGGELVAQALAGGNTGAGGTRGDGGGGSGVPAASAERRVGVVRVIGARGKFVLIETTTGSGGVSLGEGQELRCRGSAAGGGEQTAVLKVSQERQAPFLVADVVSGEPQVGNVAYSAIEKKK
jgi:hypothetical protein